MGDLIERIDALQESADALIDDMDSLISRMSKLERKAEAMLVLLKSLDA